jgi:hypothetical protein
MIKYILQAEFDHPPAWIISSATASNFGFIRWSHWLSRQTTLGGGLIGGAD